MTSPWLFITRRFREPDTAPIGALSSLAPVAEPRQTYAEETRVPPNPLDGIGQRDELLRVRMSEMFERLEDLKTLGQDFTQILAPMEAISSELPVAKGRLAELEVLLAREVDSSQMLRREVDDLSARASALVGDLSAANGRAGRLEANLRDREANVEELRLALREKTIAADEIERRLASEVEQAETLAIEVKSLRSEMQIADQALLDADRRMAELGERRGVSEGEARRFRQLAEEMNAKLVSAGVRIEELDQALEESLTAAAGLEIQLAEEQAAQQRAQAEHDADLTATRTENANLTMKADSLAARHAATEQILGQVRGQLREKEDALRLAERSAKDAAGERVTLDRRLEATREDLARRDASLAEGQRARAELEDRLETMSRTLAAREALLEDSDTKTRNLAERVDALTARYERERQSLEIANRKLLEELQNERAERTLAQGALDIARESRLSLQRQNETLKRAVRQRQGERVDVPGEVPPPPPSNVAFFPAGDRRNDEARG